MYRRTLTLLIMIGALVWAQGPNKVKAYVEKDIIDANSGVNVIRAEKIKTDSDSKLTPNRMNFQGYLTDNTGTPINGSVPITFSIWNAFSGGNKLWEEVDTVYCQDGLFWILIGTKVPINPSVFTGGNYRTLQLVIDGQTMSSRIVVTCTGYAYSCAKSDSSAWAYDADRLDGHHWSEVPSSADYIDEGQTAGGDLYGTYPNPQVDGLRGRPVSSNAPATGYVLKWNGSQWAPAQDETGSTLNPGNGLYASGNTWHVGQGTGITVGSDDVAFNTSWGDSRYVNEGQSNSISTAMLQNDAVTGTKLANQILMGDYSGTGTTFQALNNGGGVAIFGGAGDNYGGHFYRSSGSSSALRGEGPSSGVYGITTNSSGDRKGGYFASLGGGGWAYVGAQISGTNYKVYGSGNVSCIMPTHKGDRVLFAPECPEPFFEDFGQGQLINGQCYIELDPLFLDCIKADAAHPMRVFIQLNDNCNGVYVKVGTTGFNVYELQNGSSNALFTYRIVANRKDTEYLRLPPSVDHKGLEEK